MPKSPRVVDFSTHLSGPVAARRLAQFGADVIKIEHPTSGDGNRLFPPMFHEDGVHHLYLNAGTRSLAIHPKAAEWPAVVKAAAEWADVVIVGNHPQHAERLGIDAPTVLQYNDQLIYCAITGYGVDGEWSTLPAHGLNMDALAGALSVEWVDGGPRIPESYRSVGTTVAGIEAVSGIFAALYRRNLGEGGQIVHVSIWEAALAAQWRDSVTLSNLDRRWPAYRDFGSRYDVYATKDGKALLVCPIEEKYWHAFCDVLALPEDVRSRGDWSSGVDMGQDYAALGERELITACLVQDTRDAWLARLRAANVPVAPVLDLREVLSSEHAGANGVLARYQYRDRNVTTPVAPVSITPTRGAETASLLAEVAKSHQAKANELGRAPFLSEHRDEILLEFGIAVQPTREDPQPT